MGCFLQDNLEYAFGPPENTVRVDNPGDSDEGMDSDGDYQFHRCLHMA